MQVREKEANTKSGTHTCEEVSDLSDEIPEFLIALVHSLFGLVGLQQDILSTQLSLVCLQLGLRNLDQRQTENAPSLQSL